MRTQTRGSRVLLAAWACAAGLAVAGQEPPAGVASRYTFSWPLGPDAPAPRGGTTRGVPVELEREPSSEWRALQAKDLASAERDRRAILAMAGSYRVNFDFLEIASFTGAGERPRPYQSWGTEKVYVDRDTPAHVSLVHILEMRVVDAEGKVSEPMVTKHWRQDWHYEPASVVEYRGNNRWQERALSAAERAGRWAQTVYQVDEAPRYGSIGRWEHNAAYSSWISGETSRPLPRREWSVRKDYALLTGTNRHTILPTGWLQEENNLKDTGGSGAVPYVGREYGVARYERLKNADFSAADRYYATTREFWNLVLADWQQYWQRQDAVTLTAHSDQSGAVLDLFELAEEFSAGKIDAAALPARIRAAHAKQGAQ